MGGGEIPAAIDYIRRIHRESAYVPPYDKPVTNRVNKRRLYTTVHTMMRAEAGSQELRISRLKPNTHWGALWRNLHDTPVPQREKVEWYKVIHDIIPTHDRLNRIRLAPSNKCQTCSEPDTIAHRILDCGNGRRIRQWTKERLAQILNTTPDQIPDEWPACPQYIIRPQRRNRDTSWMLATLITCRMNTPPTTTLQDYIEILKRSR